MTTAVPPTHPSLLRLQFFLVSLFMSLRPGDSTVHTHFCNTSSIPIRLRFLGDCRRLLSLSSSLSELRCTPAIAAEDVSCIGGMLEGPRAGAMTEDADTDGSWVSRIGPGGGAGIVVVVEGMYGEVMVEGLVGGRRGSNEDPSIG
jgi:hypothetical protein